MMTTSLHQPSSRREVAVRRALQRSPLLSALPESAFNELARAATVTRLPRRASLRGELPGLYVIASGRVRVVRRVGDRSVTLRYISAGGVFGEECVVGQEVSPEVVVMEAAEIVRIPAGTALRALESAPSVATALAAVQASRRMQLERRLVGVLTLPVEARVAAFILDAAEEHGIPDSRGTLVGEKFTHLEIAEYIGATRETVTLVLGALRREGLIDIEHRRLVVRDEPALVARAGGGFEAE